MTPPIDHAAAWQAMSDQERVEWIAREVMGWKKQQWVYLPDVWNWHDENGVVFVAKHERIEEMGWNPLVDHNHWRSVEMKVMEDSDLWREFISKVVHRNPNDSVWWLTQVLMSTDLHTRAKALYLAFQSLSH